MVLALSVLSRFRVESLGGFHRLVGVSMLEHETTLSRGGRLFGCNAVDVFPLVFFIKN